MIICVPTIMHTGTHLLRYEILKERDDHKNTESYNFTSVGPSAREDGTLLAGHLINSMMDIWEEAFKEFKIITPLRHPARVWQSFVGRRRSYRFYCEQWMNMIDVVDKYNPIYVHIDHPCRENDLKTINEYLEMDLKTDWPVSKETGANLGNHDLEITEELNRKVPQEFIDFYYDTIRSEQKQVNHG